MANGSSSAVSKSNVLRELSPHCRSGGTAAIADDVLFQGGCGRWGLHLLRGGVARSCETCGQTRQQNSPGCKARGSSCGAADEIRVSHQSQDCPGARHNDPTHVGCSRRRGNRMTAVGTVREWRALSTISDNWA